MVIFYPKNPKILNLCERLVRDQVTEVKSNVAREFSRYKPIRFLREKDMIFIAKDHRKDISIIYTKMPVKRKGTKFVF